MTAIILFRENPASYVAIVYEGDRLIDQMVELSVVRLRARVKAAYGIDCE